MAIRQDKPLTRVKLDEIWRRTDFDELELAAGPFVILSDLHMGNGSRADDFRHNERLVEEMLLDYAGRGFSLVLLGDVEEFWLFDLNHIRARYDATVYRAIRAFGDDRVYRIFGNHDIEWGLLDDPARSHQRTTAAASEAIKIKDAVGEVRILLIHGHQGSRNADKGSWASRFFLRLLRPMKPMARSTRVYRSPSATRSQITRDYERTFYEWAKEQGVLLICGHTHRAIFASKSYAQRLKAELAALSAGGQKIDPLTLDRKRRRLLRALERERMEDRDIASVERRVDPSPCYFNTGCALYKDGVTCIELDEKEIRLVKWDHTPDRMLTRHVYERDTLQGLLDRIRAEAKRR